MPWITDPGRLPDPLSTALIYGAPTAVRRADPAAQIAPVTAGVATDVPETVITAAAPGPAAELACPAAAR
jgi:hypothetical protein